ncbi:MAG: 2-amino-4-hydroxy-6-hydroxymethyldihydropteridine diphosphokinase [Clostridia bacterium]|nr:2-amino-4-hydroxy-6-hydroxymethyldihydropteridine diphosphokinase [Clostridia bacterium]
MNSRVWLSLGSNKGDRAAYLNFAVARLREQPDISVVQVSSLYLTEPWGVSGQEDYYNAALEISTGLQPLQLLRITQSIEAAAGRCRTARWEPRELDIDILVFGDLQLCSADLIIPHPYLGQRAFVLLPLREIAGDLNIPGQGRLDGLLAALPERQSVEKIADMASWLGKANNENH